MSESWLLDKIKSTLKDRMEFLSESTAMGLPDAEYRQFVGRYRECKRMLEDTIPEIFSEFNITDGEEEDDLDELE